ncbi:hypothetical protein B0T16DRAFT_429710 [Cercophora newfieldiana]|uniref:Cyclin n=1 Tax=Cercophora newfieldiana TaxID=92897 RepID=A0AA40CQ51_9PEZI|nr:hypothetical protein B0T16DRAFT_429710 [Cercophora newfieldiana]
METAYHLASMASYENMHAHHHSAYVPTAAPSDRPRPVLNERSAPNEQMFNPSLRCSGPAYPHHQSAVTLPQPRAAHPPPTAGSVAPTTGSSRYQQPRQQQMQPTSQQSSSTQPSTPTSSGAMADQEPSARDAAMVNHSLQIPQCISPKGGNLADFVADITALFWFESTNVLDTVEQIRSIPASTHIRRIPESARATRNFKKWVQTVLSTTQVTQNVVLLALLFIYRLKLANPKVSGRQGSEYRLFTVALMLGNKFLDDNTYTNKTWADVSGISVNEIHVMEVEFLSNMRYSLLASKEQWEEWLVRLAKLYEFLERAHRAASPSPLLIPSPSHRSFNSPLPSPTGAMQLTPQPAHTYSPNGGSNSNSQSWPSFSQNNAVSPLALKPEASFLHRKRSFPEDDPTEPPAKRMSRVLPPQHGLPAMSSQPLGSQQRPTALPPTQARPQGAVAPEHPRLAVPNLSVNTNHGVAGPSSQPFPAVSYAPPQASPLSLPPLVPGVRAMSTVFPPAPANYASPHPVLPSSAPHPPLQPLSVTPTTSFPPVSYGTPTKRLSPQNALTPTAPYGSSPLIDPFHHHAGTPIGNNGGASGMHTPISHSPSVYLQHRNSPYKPVRHVNTLLHPPPSGLQQYHFPNALPPTQMHYQPLGRRNELRTGIVPEFAMARAGHQGQMGGGHPALPPTLYPEAPQVLPNPVHGPGGQPTSLKFRKRG